MIQAHRHSQWQLKGEVRGEIAHVNKHLVPGGVGALQPRRTLLNTQKVRAVNLGGWLVIEKWIKPSLFDNIPDGDLLVRHDLYSNFLTLSVASK